MSSHLRQLFCLSLALAVTVGIVALTPSVASANTQVGRWVSTSGVPNGVVAGDRVTYTVKTLPDDQPVGTAGISIKSVGACTYGGYDTTTFQVTFDMSAFGGECRMLFSSRAYTSGGVDYGDAAGEVVIYADPHTRRTMSVEGLPVAGVAGDYFTFKAYTVPDNATVEMVYGGGEICRLAGINRSTSEVTVQLLRNGVCGLVLHTNADATYTLAHRTIDFTVADPRQAQAIQATSDDRPAWYEWTPLWSSTSGLPVTLTSQTPYTCQTNGNLYRPLGLGTCTITANQAGNASWWAATETTLSFRLIDKTRTQTIDVRSPGVTRTDTSFALEATNNSGLPIRYRTTTWGACTVSGNIVTTGGWYSTCHIEAYNDGVRYTWSAAQDDVTFEVVAPYQPPPDPDAQLSFPPIRDVLATDQPFAVTATGSLPTTVSTESPAVCTTSGDKGRTITVHQVGTCSLKAIQAQNQYQPPAVKYQSFQVVATPHFIAFEAVGDRVATDAAVTLAAASTDLHSAATSLPVTYNATTPDVCTTTGDQLRFTGSGTCTVTATAGGDLWEKVVEQQSFDVTPATQTLDFATLPDRVLGEGPFPLTAAASSGLPPTFTAMTPNTCVVSGAGQLELLAPGTCTIRAVAGNNVWEHVSVERTFAVSSAPVPPATDTPAAPPPAPPTPGAPTPAPPTPGTPATTPAQPLSAPAAKAKVTGHKIALTLTAAKPGTTTVVRYAKGNRYPKSVKAGKKLYTGTGAKVTRRLPKGTYKVVVFTVSAGKTSPPRKLTIRIR